MTSNDLLADAFERVRDAVHPAANGLSPEELAFRPDPESNSIAWLVWHLTRIQDDHVAGLRRRRTGLERPAGGRSGLTCRSMMPTPATDMAPKTWRRWSPTAQMLLGYFEDVHQQTQQFVAASRARRTSIGWWTATGILR